jgi:glycosyltransferase involved in cell wall biosynthesis
VRIVYLNPVAVLGGAERSLLDVMAAIRQREPAARLYLVVGEQGPLVEQAEALGVTTTVLPMPSELQELGNGALGDPGGWRPLLSLARRSAQAGMAARRYAARLGQTVTALRPSIVHSNGIKSHLLTRLAGLTEPAVLWHIRDFLGSRSLLAPALRWAAGTARGAIAISHAVGRDAHNLLPRLPIDVAYNAVDTGYFSPAPGDGKLLDELASLPAAQPATTRIGLVATFAPWKGHKVFLEAAAHLLRRQPQARVRFYLIGGPIYRTRGSQLSESALREKVAELAIADHVGFIGFQEDTAGIYRALDIVVHPSTQPEPFGRTIVEAMACARPVIVSQAGGAVELFTHDYDALGVAPGDARALSSAMNRLMADPESRARLAANARRTAEARFTRKHLGEEIMAVYQRCLNCRRGQELSTHL